MRIGLVQSRGIGDIIIALPIAKFMVDRGDRVLWPISERFVDVFKDVAPYVEFLPLKEEPTGRWMHPTPVSMLKEMGCERIISLYSALGSHPQLVDQMLARFFKFDEYKYTISEVPFREKWNLKIVRNKEREEALFKKVVQNDDFVVFHLESGNFSAKVDVASLCQGRQAIIVTNITNNPFDWLKVMERASLRVMIDSCFSNLVDQLQIPGQKIFIPRSPGPFTPVLLGDWRFHR